VKSGDRKASPPANTTAVMPEKKGLKDALILLQVQLVS